MSNSDQVISALQILIQQNQQSTKLGIFNTVIRAFSPVRLLLGRNSIRKNWEAVLPEKWVYFQLALPFQKTTGKNYDSESKVSKPS